MSTSLSRRSRFSDLDSIRNQFNQLLTDLTDGQHMTMPIDLNETEEAVVVKASLPGIKPEDLKVTISNGMLTIQAESREEHEEKKGTWHLRERRAGSLYRSITLPMPVSEDKSVAMLKDGVLEITLPKTEPSAGRQIAVQAK